jgi:DNA-binding MarR family transcriptional regulator
MAIRSAPTENFADPIPADLSDTGGDTAWLERTLTAIMRRLMDTENLDMPLLQLPLAQMRLAQALYGDKEIDAASTTGETMGRLSERLNVRQNALTQAADRLVNHGLAERLSDPTDRRIVRLRLTTTGEAWVRERSSRRRARYEHLWTLLAPQERAEFLQAVRVLEAAGNRLPSGHLHKPNSVIEIHSELPTVEETLSRFTDGEAVINSKL